MNSVMNIGENIFFIKEGNLEWTGTNQEVMFSTNESFNEFVFASNLFQKVKKVEMEEAEKQSK
mgnify:CR=1 FL=1